MKLRCWIWCAESNHRNEGPMNYVLRPLIEKRYCKKINKWLKWHLWRKLWVSRNSCTSFYGIRKHRTQFLYAIFHCRIGVFIYERWRVEDRMKSERKKRTYRIKEQIKFAKKLTIKHLFYIISIATNKRTFFKRFWLFRDTRVVDVMRFATNLLMLWATVVNGFFLYLVQIITSMRKCHE